MKPLIAIYSCEADIKNGRNQALRQTWAQDAKKYFDVLFFIGTGTTQLTDDEIRVDAYDGGDALIYKEAAMLRWALERGYDKILKTETDVYLNSYLLSQADSTCDYVGAMVGEIGKHYADTNLYGFMQGHAVWYSRKAAQFIADELVETAHRLQHTSKGSAINYSLRSADMWSGQVLIPKYIQGVIRVKSDLSQYGHGPLSWHREINKDNIPTWLYDMHKLYGEKKCLLMKE